HGEAVVARLRRFLLRTKADVDPLPWRAVALRGPGADRVEGLTGLVVPTWPGVEGVDALGEDVAPPDGVARATAADLASLRVRAGVPAMGAELTASTIPAEVGRHVLGASVSFTKGCYTGQELVARIDSRGGNVPRPLRGIVIATNVLPPVGADVVVGGDVVGSLTSVAESLERRAPVALAHVARKVEPPVDATVRWDGGETPARVEPLPLV